MYLSLSILIIINPIEMRQISLVDPDPTETLGDICWHNIVTSDKYHDLQSFSAASMAWISLNPDKNFSHLESELRLKNLNTHLLACNPKEIPDTYLGLYRDSDSVTQYEYQCIFSCRPAEYALEELLLHWPSYEDNFNHLDRAGILIAKDANQIKPDADVQLLDDKQKSLYQLIQANEKKLVIVVLSAQEVIEQLISKCVEKFGKKPEEKLVAMSPNGSPIMALFLDNQLISEFGFVTEIVDGKSVTSFIKLQQPANQ